MGRYVLGVSGASGMILALRALRALTGLGHQVELVMSQHALYTAAYELGKDLNTPSKFVATLPPSLQENVRIHPIHDVGCAIASGSYLTDGMLIIPCSMATVGAIACGLADNVLRRAADVAFKEKRRLVIVPRETPFSTLHLENLSKLSHLGAVIVPPAPAWYLAPQSLEEVELFIVGKALDALGVSHQLYKRWKSD